MLAQITNAILIINIQKSSMDKLKSIELHLTHPRKLREKIHIRKVQTVVMYLTAALVRVEVLHFVLILQASFCTLLIFRYTAH